MARVTSPGRRRTTGRGRRRSPPCLRGAAADEGLLVTTEDMHNAWAAWAAMREPGHDALVPYADLPGDVAQPGRPYLDAIRRVADSSISGSFAQTLLPYGIPVEDKDRDRLFELYKIVVTSWEALVGRRQAFNTFFITIQGALVAVAGLLLRGSGQVQSKAVALTALAIVGGVIAYSWGSLLRSYGQLNGGKFKVINTLEWLSPRRSTGPSPPGRPGRLEPSS